MMKYKFLLSLFAICFLLQACDDGVAYSAPKPRAFPKVEYPTRAFQKMDVEFCQFLFEYPTYASVEQDTAFFDEKPVNPCWFDINMPVFDAKLHCSYYPVGNNFEKLREDAFDLASKHNIKANFIDELPVQKPNGVSGFVFDIEGPVASPFQFYLTDEKNHFLRASLYFNTQARPDSLAPVFNFIKEDLMHMINTFEWKK